MTNKKRSDQPAPTATLSDEPEARRALQQSHFVPFFQPMIRLRTGQLAGFEVLARWQHPGQGIIPPDKFIGLAEQNGWIDDLTHQILDKSFAAAALLPDHLTLSINVSPHQLQGGRLPGIIRTVAANTGFALTRLIIEVTESALIDNLLNAEAVIAELKTMGCRLSLDDFGTGYSSLHHLHALPFEELKVDRSFVSSMTEKRESRKIVAAVIGLGQSLDLTTVAEGIETKEQAEMMLWLGCEIGQGYFYGRPAPESELAAMVAKKRHKLVIHGSSPWKRISPGNRSTSPSERLSQLQAVYDGAPVGLAFIDQKLTYVNINERLADMNGTPVEDHLGSKVSEIIPSLFPHVEPYLRRALKGEAITDVEVELPGSGEARLISYQPAIDEAGEVLGVSLAVMDITERKRTDEALRQSEAHYRSMVELNPQVLWIMDPAGRNLDFSPRWDKHTGLMKPPPVDHDWLTFVHPDDIQPTVQTIAESRRRGEPINVRYRVANAAGHWEWKLSMGSPRFDADGNIVCWYGSVQDIPWPGTLPNPPLLTTGDMDPLSPTDHAARLKVDPESSRADPFKAGSLRLKSKRQRQQALAELSILDTPPEAEFDNLVSLASKLCSAPISLVCFLDTHRQWFKASVGLATTETPLSYSFCLHAVQQQGLFVVEDATKDPRFEQNPLVTGEPHIRFYAGMPLFVGEGVAVGALCIIDSVARSLEPNHAKALVKLRQQVQSQLELRYARMQQRQAIVEDETLSEPCPPHVKNNQAA